METEKIQHPLMYKGYLIKQEGERLSAENLSNGHKLQPLFKSFDTLKIIIDKLKETY
jgi:hypothetical protein